MCQRQRLILRVDRFSISGRFLTTFSEQEKNRCVTQRAEVSPKFPFALKKSSLLVLTVAMFKMLFDSQTKCSTVNTSVVIRLSSLCLAFQCACNYWKTVPAKVSEASVRVSRLCMAVHRSCQPSLSSGEMDEMEKCILLKFYHEIRHSKCLVWFLVFESLFYSNEHFNRTSFRMTHSTIGSSQRLNDLNKSFDFSINWNPLFEPPLD